MSKTTIPRGGLGGGLPSSLTVGSAAAEDTKVVFDGNAQDYHIGLDDSADDLVIGLGSALGTTAHIVTDENGHVTKPLQSGFIAQVSSEISNVTGDNTAYTIAFDTEIVDRNADYNNSTYAFTAPVTGLYQITATAALLRCESDHDQVKLYANTSNRSRFLFMGSAATMRETNGAGNLFIHGSATVDMDANDTCDIGVQVYSGSKVVDMGDNAYFSAWLLG